MSIEAINVFRPVEGAVLDLESLQAVSDTQDAVLTAWLHTMWPGASSLILSGFEVHGEWAPQGPPGTVRPDAKSDSIVVTPGTAILTGQDRRKYLVNVEEELTCPWPTAAGPAVQGVLVLVPKVEPAAKAGGVVVAREQVSALLGFVKPEQAEQPFLLPIAQSLGNGRDWATDHGRFLQPEHDAIQTLLKRFQELERTVWRAEPEGSVWERQVLGRNWVRYQTVAASALQAARISLQSRATTTLDRTRTLNSLFEQLHFSVERAANDLIQLESLERYIDYLDVGGLGFTVLKVRIDSAFM